METGQLYCKHDISVSDVYSCLKMKLLSRCEASLDVYVSMFLLQVRKLSWSFAKHQFLLLLYALGYIPKKFQLDTPECYSSTYRTVLLNIQWMQFRDYILQLERVNYQQFKVFDMNLYTWTRSLDDEERSCVADYFNLYSQLHYRDAAEHYKSRLQWFLQAKTSPVRQSFYREWDSGLRSVSTFPFFRTAVPPPPAVKIDASSDQQMTGIIPLFKNEGLVGGSCSLFSNGIKGNVSTGVASSPDRISRNYEELSDHQWVVNLSKHVLSDIQLEALKFGFKYAICDNYWDPFALVPQIENIVGTVTNPVDAQILRSRLTNKIKRAFGKRNKCIDADDKNLRLAINELRKNESIVVLNSDKGNKTVVMERTDYESKLFEYLEKPDAIFEKIEKNPLEGIKRSINEKLTELVAQKSITVDIQRSLKPTSSCNIPKLFAQVKLHKEGYPIRPIVNNSNGPCTNLEKFLARLLNPYRQFATYAIQNSKDLVKNKLPNVLLPSNFKMYSIDVSDMFNSLPRPFVIDAVKHFVNLDPALLPISEAALVKLINIIWDNSFCHFKNKFYKQKDGLAMGGSASPILAEMAMSYFEISHMNDPGILMYARYVDDSLLIWKGTHRQFEIFLRKINSVNPKIKFTCESESKGELNFLDITLVKNQNFIEYKVFRKHTYSGRYLSFKSKHPLSTKRGVATNLFMRAFALSSSETYQDDEIGHIFSVLKLNHYPYKIVRSSYYSAKNSVEHPKTTITKKQTWKQLMYIPDLFENIVADCKNLELTIAAKPLCTLADIYYQRNQKERDLLDTEGCVYAIECECGDLYIGETKRKLKIRINEHKRFSKTNFQHDPNIENKSAVAAHAIFKNHNILWEKATVLIKEKNDRIRKIKEAFLIQVIQPKINVSPGVSVPPQWFHILKNGLVQNDVIKRLVQNHATSMN